MTEILLVCGSDGAFRRFQASGHACFVRKGKDIVCAAETIVLRTAITVLEKTEGIEVETEKTLRGHLALSVKSGGSENAERLVAVADFIREAIKSLENEYPGHLKLQEKYEN